MQRAVTSIWLKLLIAARCNVDLQANNGYAQIHIAAKNGRVAVVMQLVAARCNVDLKGNNGATALQFAERHGHGRIATLIRNKKHKSDDRAMKDTKLQASLALLIIINSI